MNIVVCIKQVPDTKGGVQFNPDGTLNRAAMLTIMNPDDKAGLEAALRIKDETGAHVTALTMGLPKAEEVLREAMAMGADDGILETALLQTEFSAVRTHGQHQQLLPALSEILIMISLLQAVRLSTVIPLRLALRLQSISASL